MTRQALAAGKHVYSEKPLATTAEEGRELLDEAERRGLRIACAPDVFLGSSYQAARALLDEGAIGEPLSVSAAMLVGGQTTWHPNPDIFFADGRRAAAGHGAVLPDRPRHVARPGRAGGGLRVDAGRRSRDRIGRVQASASPRETPTHTAATLRLESGVTANLVASFEAPGQYVCDFVIHGTRRSARAARSECLRGPVRFRTGRQGWQDVPLASRGGLDARGIGLDDLAESLAAGRPHRASGELACHVVDVARTILEAAAAGRALDVATTVERPAPLPVRAPD